MKLFIVVNVDYFFLSHRKDIALAAQSSGWEVTIVTTDTGKLKDIETLGLNVINLPMSRSGKNIKEELGTLFFLRRLYQREKPDVVHHVGMKTIFWGTLAAKFVHVNGIVNAISGLGVFFAEDNRGIICKLALKGLQFSHHCEHLLCIFQNQEDKDFYIKNGIIKKEQTRIIRGSGIDLNVFCYTPEPKVGKTIILLTCRMIREKGVFVLTNAAELLKKDYYDRVEFWIAGGLDDHPSAITKDEIEAACDGTYIKWLGRREDVNVLLQQCHIFAYPSYYQEGVPKSLIEAAAVGRPIVTTNNVGCKDVVENGVNGYLVPVKDAASLAEKLQVLINQEELRLKMGKASREIAEKHFSLKEVIKKHLSIYQQLLAS